MANVMLLSSLKTSAVLAIGGCAMCGEAIDSRNDGIAHILFFESKDEEGMSRGKDNKINK